MKNRFIGFESVDNRRIGTLHANALLLQRKVNSNHNAILKAAEPSYIATLLKTDKLQVTELIMQ